MRADAPVMRRQSPRLKIVLLAAVIGVHLGAFTLLLPPARDVGRITPHLQHPVRVRLLEGTPSTVAQSSSMRGSQSNLNAPAPALPEALLPEGRIDDVPENYVAVSERYFPVAELGQRPAAIALPSLETLSVSPLARGTVVLRLYINETGMVDRIEVEDSSLPPDVLARLLALRSQLQFTPGMRNGTNVKSLVVYAVDLTAVEVTPLGSGAKASPP